MRLTRCQRAALNVGAANRAYMARTGMTYSGQRLWTAEEIDTLKRLYPNYEALTVAIPDRTRKAIGTKLQRCNLATPRRVWSEAEFEIMKPLYVKGAPMSTILDRLPGKTARQVWAKASHHKVRRPRRPPRKTGLALVDEVRRRAFDLHFTTADLDAISARRNYFRRPKRTDWAALQRVLPYLDGRATVFWHGD